MAHSPRPARHVKLHMRWIVAGLMIAGLARAAALPADLRRIAGLAASLPPEFQADTLLQILESRGGLDPDLKKDLIGDAFTAAQQARSPYPQVAIYATNPDTRQAFLSNASSLKLDRLSLHTRAIRLLLAFDPSGARHLFERVQRPAVPKAGCGDALIPRLDDYYDVAAQIVSRGFTPPEIGRQEHVALLMQIMAGVEAPYEAGPAARMIANAALTPRQFEAALNAFTARLETIVHDDRSFTETVLSTQQEIVVLAAQAVALDVPRATLARAYRKYLTSNFSQPRCGDSMGARISGSAVASPIDWFNESDLRSGLPVIQMKEVAVKGVQGNAQVDTYWTTLESEKILITARALRMSPGGVFYSVQERSTQEWSQRLTEFVEQLNQWKQSEGESELDFFHEKAIVHESLIDLCPSGEGRQKMIAAFVDFLKGSAAAQQSPAEWFWHAQDVFRRLRQSGDEDATKLMAAYRGSGSLILEVYAQLNSK